MQTIRLKISLRSIVIAWFCLISLGTIVYLKGSSISFSSHNEQTQPSSATGKPFSIKMFKALKIAEEYYKNKLQHTSKEEISKLEKLTHRSLELNWDSKFGFLPPSKPVPYRECLHLYSSDTSLSAKVSVLITFKDELASILLRTITSIVIRTPENLLHELVLIDDGSLHDNQIEVEEYTAYFGVTLRWYRLNVSIGIANARHYGLKLTTGTVVVILDSHMVVSDMWLPPLLRTLVDKPRGIAVPLVQMTIDDQYIEANSVKTTPYTWKLIRGYGTFYWSIFQPNASNPAQIHPSAAIGGGALAANRDNLLHLWPRENYTGFWGVENVRLSLRAWACGEGMWLNVCSQVVHPNGLDPGLKRYGLYDPVKYKNRRVAIAAEISNIMKDKGQMARILDSTDFGNYRADVTLKSDQFAQNFNYTKCAHNYSWYLKNIHQSYNYQFFDDQNFEHVGIFQSASENDQCIVNGFVDSPEQTPDRVKTDSACNLTSVNLMKIDVSDRHLMGFSKDPSRVVTVADGYYGLYCWDGMSPGDGAPIKYWSCENKPVNSPTQQQFRYNIVGQQIEHVHSGRCVEMMTGQQWVELNKCDQSKLEQRWVKHVPSWLRK